MRAWGAFSGPGRKGEIISLGTASQLLPVSSPMTPQTAFQIVLSLGLIAAAVGGFGAYRYGKIEDAETKLASDAAQQALKEQLAAFQANFNEKTELVFQALGIKQDVWLTVEMKNVPPGVTDYLLLLFTSDKGRISGKARIQGSDIISSFSTTVNNKIPVAVPNLWVEKDQSYKVPTVLEFAVTQKTESDSTLSIYTQGWIDSRGREPH